MGQMFGQSMQQQQSGGGQSQGQPQGQGGPPPLPQQTTYYVAEGGQQTGPFDMATIQSRIQSGAISKDTLVWKAGMASWEKAGDVGEISPLFGQAPPPLPQP
jgi:hypothetical protein